MVTRVFILLLALAGVAQARHTDETRVTDYSAYTLAQWELRLGPFRSAVGIFDSVELGLNTTLTAIGIVNLYVKWTPWTRGRWAVAVQAGVAQADETLLPGEGEPTDGREIFTATAVPLELVGSYRTEQSSYHLGLVATPIESSGELPESLNFDGAGAYSTVLVQATWEWRLSDVTAVVVQGRAKLSERVAANGSTRVDLDEDSFAVIHGSGGGEILGAKGSLTVSGYWSWDTFNLRAGIGYGHYTLPVVNVFLAPGTIPELAMYWRF